MMIPTDCDQRDERLGWTGDSALASEEALSQFDMGAFYHNWAKMIDESSPNGAVADTIPTKAGGGNGEASSSASIPQHPTTHNRPSLRPRNAACVQFRVLEGPGPGTVEGPSRT